MAGALSSIGRPSSLEEPRLNPGATLLPAAVLVSLRRPGQATPGFSACDASAVLLSLRHARGASQPANV